MFGKQLVDTVRKTVEKAKTHQKHQAFSNDFRRGQRRHGEDINDFISRRIDEYERLKDLSGGKTLVSDDLRAFFLLEFSGVTEEQHKRILASAGNDYGWDSIVEAMQIQLDSSHARPNTRPFGKGGISGRPC